MGRCSGGGCRLIEGSARVRSPRLVSRSDRTLLGLWLGSVAGCTAVWVAIQWPPVIEAHGASAPVISVAVIGCALLGVAYGSFGSALVVAMRALFKHFGEEVPLAMAPARAWCAAALMYVVHVLGVGLLSLMGLWHHPLPWLLGLVPLLFG